MALGLFFCISGQAALALAEPHQARQAELLHLLRQDCGACHGMTLKGGLGLPLLPESLDGKSDDSLAAIILDGVPNTPMPPWRSEISPEEAIWLVRRMKEGITK
ncbi:MAG: cytochrome c [Rhodospirillaceae bacterium]|nr:cytochrome c [Rhodospirillaceae bacterium]MBT5659098.1 cytochrome c [Rhodospirillaceae bacterium]MBT5751143.1 cytochrome c [Rhodospirillaceae bacterium]